MWRHLGPLTTWTTLYGLSILVYTLLSYLISNRLQLRRRVWMILSVAYLVGMTAGAKVLYDLQHDEFNLLAFGSIKHYLSGGLWGGVLAISTIMAAKSRSSVVGSSSTSQWTQTMMSSNSMSVMWMFVSLATA